MALVWAGGWLAGRGSEQITDRFNSSMCPRTVWRVGFSEGATTESRSLRHRQAAAKGAPREHGLEAHTLGLLGDTCRTHRTLFSHCEWLAAHWV